MSSGRDRATPDDHHHHDPTQHSSMSSTPSSPSSSPQDPADRPGPERNDRPYGPPGAHGPDGGGLPSDSPRIHDHSPGEQPAAGDRSADSLPPGDDFLRVPISGDGGAAGGGDPDAPPGLTSEEEVLRRLLHDTVQDLRPSPRTLDQLRRAVPARRAHRRQALVGAAASLLLAVTAVPALINTASTANSSASRTGAESTQHSDHGGQGLPELGNPSEAPVGKPTGGGASQGRETAGKDAGESSAPPKKRPGGAAGGADPSGSAAAEIAVCVPAQLSPAPAVFGEPDADGKVYGTFRVVNASQDTCSVMRSGTIDVQAQGSADPAKVQAVAHSPGGPATGLPATTTQQTIVLQPGDAYLVKIGWVPESGTNGCEAASGSSGSGGSGGSGDDSGGSTGTDGGQTTTDAASEPPPGSVVVTYTPDGGGATATGQISDVCAGTVYYTVAMTEAA